MRGTAAEDPECRHCSIATAVIGTCVLYFGAWRDPSAVLPLYILAGLGVGAVTLTPIVMFRAFPAAPRFSRLSFVGGAEAEPGSEMVFARPSAHIPTLNQLSDGPLGEHQVHVWAHCSNPPGVRMTTMRPSSLEILRQLWGTPLGRVMLAPAETSKIFSPIAMR